MQCVSHLYGVSDSMLLTHDNPRLLKDTISFFVDQIITIADAGIEAGDSPGELEAHGDGHDHGYDLTVERRRCVAPLMHGVERCPRRALPVSLTPDTAAGRRGPAGRW